MTERWQRELGKLETLEAPPRVRERAAQGPDGRGGPPMPGGRQRVLAAVVAFVVFGAAGAFVWSAFRENETGVIGQVDLADPLVIVLSQTGVAPPTASVTFGGADAALVVDCGDATWSGVDAWECPGAAMAFPVPSGTPVRVEGSADRIELAIEPDTSVETDTGAIALDPADAVIDVPPGTYTLRVVGHWPQGRVGFIAGFEVIPATGDRADAATPEPPEVREEPAGESEEPAEVSEEPADALRVRCEPEGPLVLTPVVIAQPDGLRIDPVDVPTTMTIGIVSDQEPDTSLWAGSSGAQRPFSRPVVPGRLQVACAPAGAMNEADMEAAFERAATVRLIDPAGVFVPYALACDDQAWTAGSVWEIDPDDPVDDLITWFEGERPSDRFEPAGYPEDDMGGTQWWRIVRDGSIIGALTVGTQGNGSVNAWLCSSSGISAPDGR